MHSPDPKELVGIATTIALEAGEYLRASREAAFETVSTKSSLVDMVTDVDRHSETLIVARILDARPGDGVLGEEHGVRDENQRRPVGYRSSRSVGSVTTLVAPAVYFT